jgi:hypothetical protein
MEYWNADLKKMIFIYLILVKRNFTTTQFSIFSLSRRLFEPEAQNPMFSPSRRHYEPEASVPIFQHSNCERSELTCSFKAGKSLSGFLSDKNLS